MFHPSHYDNTRPDGHGVLEVQDHTEATQDGHFVPLSPDRRFVPLKRTEVRGGIQGPLADLSLTQTFGYTSEQCVQTLEAVYRFPLPGDAAVQGVCVRFGEVEIRAELKERSEAEEEYATARNE